MATSAHYSQYLHITWRTSTVTSPFLSSKLHYGSLVDSRTKVTSDNPLTHGEHLSMGYLLNTPGAEIEYGADFPNTPLLFVPRISPSNCCCLPKNLLIMSKVRYSLLFILLSLFHILYFLTALRVCQGGIIHYSYNREREHYQRTAGPMVPKRNKKQNKL
jgi:hypothetical protein